MSDQIILKSVGSYVDTNGHVGPLDKDGYPDMYEGTSVDVLDVDDEWVDQLSEEDCRSFLSVVLYRNKPLSNEEEFRMRPSEACWEGEVSEQEWMDINKGE